jgi:hypothetical protein
MTNIEKLNEDCITDLNLILKKELNKKWCINSVCRNYFSINLGVGYIHIWNNSKFKISISTNNETFSPFEKKYIEFYSIIHKFLTDKEFQKKITKRYLIYKKIADKIVNNNTYILEYKK